MEFTSANFIFCGVLCVSFLVFAFGQQATVAVATDAPSQTFHGQIGQTGKYQCWECNVWKAGYGVLCINPRVREQCFVCMTVNTTIYMGYYKDTPRLSNKISRVCGKSRYYPMNNGCVTVQMGDGFQERCYCSSDLCNSANSFVSHKLGVFITTLLVLTISRLSCQY